MDLLIAVLAILIFISPPFVAIAAAFVTGLCFERICHALREHLSGHH